MATHTVNMTNNCGFGVVRRNTSPTLDQIPSITLATGSQSYTNATVQAGAFLNTGYCGPNGGNCTTVDISMNDTMSVVVVDLIPTHVFSVPVGFTYFNGCDGAGVSCLSADCINAIRDPSEDSGIVTCSVAGAGVLVTFCPNFDVTSSTTSMGATASPSSTTTSASSPTSTTSSNRSALIGGVVGGAVGALLVGLIISLVCFFRRRRQRRTKPGEEFHIEEFTTPAPYSVHPPEIASPVTVSTRKTDGYNSSTFALVRSSATSLDPVAASSPVSLSSGGGQLGLRPLPLPPAQQPSPSSPAGDRVSRSLDLDRIVEGLAERFGWTAPPPGVDSATLTSRGGGTSEPPEYR
ncbi:hypothetical protein F5I97DRAFT_228907 [Phlebopus sp. FC_14]|nr:hypothetical protein F5I97DRAFT_228907 [Phlebopus sp. FC_14]